jgi:hypothetical protein
MLGGMQAALRPGVRHLSFRLPPAQDETWDESEAKDRWSIQLGDVQPRKVSERIDIELRSISPQLVQQHRVVEGRDADAIALRLRHPPLVCRQVGLPSLSIHGGSPRVLCTTRCHTILVLPYRPGAAMSLFPF